jgi:hypothetical protein
MSSGVTLFSLHVKTGVKVKRERLFMYIERKRE